jgi:phosphate starvation-inducible protein PhoH
MFPVNFARGMSWNNKCIIFDEVQNSSAKEITTVLTRMGKHSRCFILADPMQSDLRGKDCAFEEMFKLFSDQESHEKGIRTFEFDEEDIMRSELVKYLIKKLKKLKK